MVEWVKLLIEKPTDFEVYKCLCYSQFGERWSERFLKWTDAGFQPLDYGERGTYPIDMGVTHWLKVETPAPPISEAAGLVIETEVFFKCGGLEAFAQQSSIEVYDVFANAIEYVISNTSNSILTEMRSKFQSNGVRSKVRKPQ